MAEGADAKKRESQGGVAFEVILKAATGEAPHVPASPSRDRTSFSQEDIDRKLQEAKERRELLEIQRLGQISKDMEKVHEVGQKLCEQKASFAEEVEKKLFEKMQTTEEKKKALEKARLEKLKEHDQHVEEVRKKKQEKSEAA